MSDSLAQVKAQTGLDIRIVNIDDIEPNEYNPNLMESDFFTTLAEAIKEEGTIQQPVLVRPKPKVEGKYIIVDGEHRWRSARIAGLTKLAVVVANYDETKSKVKTLAMNRIHGQDVPIKLARLIVDLQRTYSDKEIAAMTGVRLDEQASVLALLNVPDINLDGMDSAVIREGGNDRPIEVSLFLLPDEHQDYENAMSRAIAHAGTHVTALLGEEVQDYDTAMRDTQSIAGMKLRNVALATICRVFNQIAPEEKRRIILAMKENVGKKIANK